MSDSGLKFLHIFDCSEGVGSNVAAWVLEEEGKPDICLARGENLFLQHASYIILPTSPVPPLWLITVYLPR